MRRYLRDMPSSPVLASGVLLIVRSNFLLAIRVILITNRTISLSISPSTHRDRMPKASPLLPSALLNQVSRPRATSVPAADLMSP